MKILQTLLLKQWIFQYIKNKTPTVLLYQNFHLDFGMDFANIGKQ